MGDEASRARDVGWCHAHSGVAVRIEVASGQDVTRAEAVRQRLVGASDDPVSTRPEVALVLGAQGWAVEAPLATGRARLHLDATHPKVRRRLLDARQGHSNLGRALGKLRGGVAWDLTAGLGRDALSLAARGFEVLAVERDPIVFTLLEDVVDRLARHHEPWGAELSSRVEVWHGEASAFLAQATEVPDVVLLDPMFSEKTRRGQVKKDLAILQHLLGAQPGATEGLVQTLTSWLAGLPEPPMVLVKRAKGAPSLWPRVDRKVGSGAVRFDVHRGPWSCVQEAS